MEMHEFTIPYKSGESFYISGLGDLHIGNIAHNKDAMKKAIKFINDNQCYIILMGDLIDAIVHTDKRWDIQSIAQEYRDKTDNLISEQYETLCNYLDMLDPTKIIGVHTGNHEDKIRERDSRNITYDLCRDYDLKYLGYEAWTRIKFKRSNHTETFKVFSSHGYGGGKLPQSKMTPVFQTINQLDDVDLVMIGHVHDVAVGRVERRTIPSTGNLYLQKKTIAWMLTGSFLNDRVDGSITYPEKKGYGMTKNGIATFKVYPESRRIHVSC